MPPTLNFPGVYIQEIPSPVHTIAGVPTAVAAFVGRARRGPVQSPVRIHSFADFERAFGGLWNQSELGYLVSQYFLNGGADAYVVRVVSAAAQAAFDAGPPQIALPTTPAGTLNIAPKNPGSWFAGVSVSVDHNTRKVGGATIPTEYNLTVRLTETDLVTGATNVTTETFRNLTNDPSQGGFVSSVLSQSNLVETVGPVVLGATPNDTPGINAPAAAVGADGTFLAAADLTPVSGVGGKRGIYALEDAEIFTILVIPPYSPNENGGIIDVPLAVWQNALVYCRDFKRAMLIVDPSSTWTTKALAVAGLPAFDSVRDRNSVMYFPHVFFADPLLSGASRAFAPSGALAGVMARIDSTRGVWKAPAGEEAKIAGNQGLDYALTDLENGELNPVALNCLRTFPIVGTVVWGARTLEGADSQASEWKYLPVRRTALFIEESLFRGTKWILFESNDEPLWSQIRLNVGAFMRSLFNQGAFQGATPKDAYFVKCDLDTTTQDDINKGVVNILVGFAPLKPVEFVVIKISQIVGQIQV
jgi:phage tail sheath protein FI